MARVREGSVEVLLTGATDGIGKASALQLARAGLRVLVHGRSAPKVEGDEKLHAFDGETGAELGAVPVGPMRRFVTPIAARGRIYVAADGAVMAFAP